MIEIPLERRKAYLRTCRILAVVAGVMALIYMKWLLFDAKPENHVLYGLLVAAETFNIAQAAGFWITISVQRWREAKPVDFSTSTETVDLFITVCGEPPEIVRQTVDAARAVRHPRARIWVLDDGPSAEIEALAAVHGVGYLRRPNRRGAKAGNLNDALARTDGTLFAIFDADQTPHPDFLEATLGLFEDPKIAFVQTPQIYRNRIDNRVAAGAHDQQALFYGPILRGKDGCGAVFSCGTNVVFSRAAILDVGGMPEDSITEDLRVSLTLLRKGYRSAYVSRVLAEGIGPMDVAAFFSQQLRWARGGLEILLKRRPFSTRMSVGQALQYLLGFMYWFTGWAYLAYLVLPLTFLFVGLRPIQVPNEYPAHFLPYVLAALGSIIYASNFDLRFRALWFTLGSFPVHVRAMVATLLGGRAGFVITPKAGPRTSLRPVVPIIAVATVLGSAAVYGLATHGPDPSVVNNVAWVVGHFIILQGFVRLSLRPTAFVSADESEAIPETTPAEVSA